MSSAPFLTRRDLLRTGALLAAVGPATSFGIARAGTDRTLRPFTLPTRVFRTPDAGREQTESWIFWLFVETDTMRTLDATRLRVTAFSGTRQVQSLEWTGDGITALKMSPPIANLTVDGTPSSLPVVWPLAVRVRGTATAATPVERLAIELSVDEAGTSRRVELDVAVESYTQKNALVFPFVGRGLVTQGGVTNGGHRNRSGQFSLDVMGLDDRYGVYRGRGESRNRDYAGWGRVLIAPAAGTVVRVRDDRPDQPRPEVSDPRFHAPEHPNGGDPGNHLVIDHGQGEFSLLAHLQAGSVRVKSGERVVQGQALGKLGNSGDTNAPHLHYQLQSGADWQWCDALPVTFSNLATSALVRGEFFHAR